MKKFIVALLACFAMVQSVNAATPPLTESLLEYEAITSAIGAPDFTVIPVTEFIVDIRRLTRQLDILGEVRYEILTRTPGESSGTECHSKHKKDRPIKYIATLNVAPNPGIGPNIVTVESIVLAPNHKHHH